MPVASIIGKIPVIYAEDNSYLRESVVKALGHWEIFEIAEAHDGRQLIQLLNGKSGIVLLDLNMPVMNGNEVMDHLQLYRPDVKVIVTTLYDHEILVEDYLARGVKGFISKDMFSGNIKLLAEIIIRVNAGETLTYTAKKFETRFTNSQKRLIPLMCHGASNFEIAKSIGVRTRSVERQKKRIYSKTGPGTALDFFKFAFSRGFQFLRKRATKIAT